VFKGYVFPRRKKWRIELVEIADEWILSLLTTLPLSPENPDTWSGTGDFTYKSPEKTVRIYDIIANPSLTDSFFEHIFS
jgi:hypothetical protein